MKVRELISELRDVDPEMEVQVRVNGSDPEEDYSEPLGTFFGEYCEVTDEGNVLVEYGKLTLIADYAGYND